MASVYSRADRMRSPRSYRARRHATAAALLVALVGVAAGGWWLLRGRGLQWSAQRGLDLLTGTQTLPQIETALAQWERETAPIWRPRLDEFVAHLFKARSIADARVRRLLARAAGVDYGERIDDWKRWYEGRKKLAAGEAPRVPEPERVRWEKLWSAPIGLTAWFSTILALDGQVYVASLGNGFEAPDDLADGVVRVSGDKGESQLIFAPAERGFHDVMGIAAGSDGLFVACRSGMVYLISPDGQQRWAANVGGAVSAPPLSIDFNRDGVFDVVVVARPGKVVAISGATGKAAWTASVAPRGRRENADSPAATVYAALSAGAITGGNPPDIVVTTADGGLYVIGANGTAKFNTVHSAGFLAGSLTQSTPKEGAPPALVGDQEATVLSLVRSGRKVELVSTWTASGAARTGIVAGLRTLQLPGDGPPAVLACTAGAGPGHGGTVSALTSAGVFWRYSTPGLIWSSPAVVNINREAGSEIIVPTIERDADGQESGVLLILSRSGHCLKRLALDAPVEAAPVAADVDGDNRLEVLLADRAGMLHCYSTQSGGPIEWGSFAGDSHNTGNALNAYSFGQRAAGYQWSWKPEF